MGLKEIAIIGKEAGKTIRAVLAQFPTEDQRRLDEIFKFFDRYNEEITRKDADHDDLLAWKERKDLIQESFFNGLRGR